MRIISDDDRSENEDVVRLTRRDFDTRVANHCGVPRTTVTRIGNAIIDEIVEAARHGEIVLLRGFGRFYPQIHKGHGAHFGNRVIDNYPVLKFSASHRLNKTLDDRAWMREHGRSEEVPEPEAA